jgi:15-cis-phytoene synthase/lycopene beta-cyclase
LHAAKLDTLAAIRAHLVAAYKPYPSQSDLDSILDDIPSLTPSARSAFHLFSSLLPNLAPIGPFLQLCSGYETDMGFITSTVKPSVSNSDAFASIQPGGLRAKLRDPRFQLEKYLPIKTTEDLLLYADDVAGSIALAICHLAWSILSTSSTPRPVGQLARSSSDLQTVCSPSESQDRDRTMRKARVMGQALQLVNIARDVAKDATIGRLYVPLSSFQSGAALLNILVPSTSSPSYAPYSLPLLDIADQLRLSSTPAMNELPPTARGGTRAMVASYFEIAEEIRLRGGEIDEKGVKVKRWRRAWAAAGAMWGWS